MAKPKPKPKKKTPKPPKLAVHRPFYWPKAEPGDVDETAEMKVYAIVRATRQLLAICGDYVEHRQVAYAIEFMAGALAQRAAIGDAVPLPVLEHRSFVANYIIIDDYQFERAHAGYLGVVGAGTKNQDYPAIRRMQTVLVASAWTNQPPSYVRQGLVDAHPAFEELGDDEIVDALQRIRDHESITGVITDLMIRSKVFGARQNSDRGSVQRRVAQALKE